MAVLYRTNAQSRPLEEAFRFRGIPYRLVGAVSFYERREVKDVLAYLRLIANPADDEAFLRIVNVPRRGIGDTSLSQLVRVAAQWAKPLLETARAADRVADLRPNVREALQAVARLMDELRAGCGDADPATALERVIAAVGYGQYLADEGPEGIERLENVQELIAGAAEWAETAAEAGDEAGDEAADAGRGEGPSLIERYLTQAALVTPADEGAGARRSSGGGTRRAARAVVEPDWEDAASQDAPRYATGERVRHRKFGSGVVRAVSGSGRDLKVTVEFDDQEIGTKQLLVAYAGLEREWESA